MGSPRLLLVEDHPELSRWLGHALCRGGYDVEVARDGLQAEDKLATDEYDLMVLDLDHSQRAGFEWLNRLRRRGNPTPVLLLMGQAERLPWPRPLTSDDGGNACKPLDSWDLENRVRALLRCASAVRLGQSQTTGARSTCLD